MPPTARMANSQRTMPSAGSMAGWMTKCPYTDTARNSTSAATWSGSRRPTARACRADGFGALSAIHAAPAAMNMARPSRPHSSVNGVMSPSSGTPT